MHLLWSLLILSACLRLCGCDLRTFGSVPEVEPHDLARVSERVIKLSATDQLQDPRVPHIIDVRTAPEYNGGHIAGAQHASFLPPWSFPSSIQPLLKPLQKDTEIYVICLSAHRSIGAYKWLRDQGYTNVKQLKGGMQNWRKHRLPEVDAEGKQVSGSGTEASQNAAAAAAACTQPPCGGDTRAGAGSGPCSEPCTKTEPRP